MITMDTLYLFYLIGFVFFGSFGFLKMALAIEYFRFNPPLGLAPRARKLTSPPPPAAAQYRFVPTAFRKMS